jgi:YbbR domain-containing protein
MAARDYILHNFWWKLLSVLLAALTWLTIETTFEKDRGLRQSPVVTTSTRSFPAIPITVLSSALNTNRYRVTPLYVSVEVSGTPDVLEKLQTKQIQAVIDVSEAPEEKEFRKDIQVQVPKDLRIVGTKPIYVTVERMPVPK